ncbi:MAG TPA: divalent-cation tolerance protein CutA [Myxococcales bacterium]|nr:divalent-cation tolerance protein CutA [Myxococcales bacterium]
MARPRTLVALSTAPASAARALARALVRERLCACVNVVPGVGSVYRWKGRIHEDRESLLVMKLAAASLPALRRRLSAVHPYELPELVALPVAGGLPAYLSWVERESGPPSA